MMEKRIVILELIQLEKVAPKLTVMTEMMMMRRRRIVIRMTILIMTMVTKLRILVMTIEKKM